MRIRAHGSTVANGAADLEARLHAQAATQAQDGTGRSRTNCNSTHSVARIHAQAQECAVAAPIVREHILQHGSTPKHRKAPSRHHLLHTGEGSPTRPLPPLLEEEAAMVVDVITRSIGIHHLTTTMQSNSSFRNRKKRYILFSGITLLRGRI